MTQNSMDVHYLNQVLVKKNGEDDNDNLVKTIIENESESKNGKIR